jgi:hypothetical protein
MKKLGIFLALSLIAGLSISLSAWKERRLITPEQELAIFSLANRYIEAFCSRPSELEGVFAGSIFPATLLNKSSDFLEELIVQEGECFGQSKTKFQEETLNEIRRLPEHILRLRVGNEYSASDFFDCLVQVERSFYDLKDATYQVFQCVDTHLDIRGAWFDVLVAQQRYDFHEPNPVLIGIPGDDIVIPVRPGYNQCLEECYNGCTWVDEGTPPIDELSPIE